VAQVTPGGPVTLTALYGDPADPEGSDEIPLSAVAMRHLVEAWMRPPAARPSPAGA
jgi:hypothetical protein